MIDADFVLSEMTAGYYDNPQNEDEKIYNLALTIAKKLIRKAPTITAEQKHGRWIPCSERLPDNGVAVLVWTGENNFKVWLAEYSKYMETWTLAGNYVPLRKNAVIAWMPLPGPPESEVQE